MDERSGQGLETALAKTEADAETALRAAASAARAVKKLRATVQAGNLREIQPSMAAAEQAVEALRGQLATAREGWDFDAESYLASGGFSRELVEAARIQGLRIFDEDDRLYCYPLLLRVLPAERAVLVDKARERRLRPSALVAQLKELQARPQRFKPQAFLETLFDAYTVLVGEQGKQALSGERIERLLDIYNLLTLLPGSGRDYTRQEFARDVYLLDQSGETTTRKGYAMRFHASSGTRSTGSTLRVITEHGQDKVYYGISFVPTT